MAGTSVEVRSSLMCPHGGSIRISSTNTRVTATNFLALQSDVFTVTGCLFVAGIIPSPCVLVQWACPDARVTVNGTPTLSQSSVGLCLNAFGLPQGPAVVQTTQSPVSSS